MLDNRKSLGFTLLIFSAITSDVIPGDVREYCASETFKAECKPGEVILMETAKYGRMSLGRCIKSDFGYIGCEENVLTIADRQCSGKRECDILVPNKELIESSPCLKELKSYFEASYECITVIQESDEFCNKSDAISVTESEGYFTSMVANDTGEGDIEFCPWKIQALPGQHVKLTIYDFTLYDTKRSGGKMEASNQTKCSGPILAVITDLTEEADKQSKEICSGRFREQDILYSESSVLMIKLKEVSDEKGSMHYLIKYKISGCALPEYPVNSTIERNGAHVTIRCFNNRQVYHVTCVGSKWIGEIGSCPEHHEKGENKTDNECLDFYQMPHASVIRDGRVTSIRCHHSTGIWHVLCEDGYWTGNVGSCPGIPTNGNCTDSQEDFT